MKIFWLMVVPGILVLFSFQNCQKSPAPDELQFYSKSVQLQPAGSTNINLAGQKLNTFEFVGRENEQTEKNGTVFTIVTDKIYQFDFFTGKMTSESEFTQVQKHYCLTESLKSELIGILKASSICAITKTVAENQVCTQSLQTGYAKVTTNQAQYNLGAATDGCGSHSVDLCDDNANLLKGFISHLKSQLNSLGCD